MMTKIALPFLLLLYLLGISPAQVMNDVSSIRQAIENINRVAPNAESDPMQMWKTPQYQALEQSSPTIWKTAVNNLEKVAATRNDQKILFQSFEGLSPEEYLQFLNKALDLYSQGKISLGVFTYKIIFPDGKMQLFISHNYDQPEVAAFLEKAEEVLKKKGEPLMFNVQEARSGKLKQLHDAARANHPELAKQPIPLLRPSAPPPPTAAQTTIVPVATTPVQQPKSGASPTPAAETKSAPSGFPVVPVAILVLGIIGVIVVLLRRKRP